MTSPAAGSGTLYHHPVLLTREQHADRRVVPVTDWRIAAALNAVPVTFAEFESLARELPLAFVPAGRDGEGRTRVAPVALLGLSEGENLCIDADGRWIGTTIPAFLRRYPFAYATADDGAPTLAVDAAWPGFNTVEGERLIADDGQPTEFLKQTLAFLERYERDTLRTRALCDRLVALDLLRGGEIRGELVGGRRLNATGFFMIDEQRLATLPDEAVLELHRSGLMAGIHAHRVSMGHVQTLAARLSA